MGQESDNQEVAKEDPMHPEYQRAEGLYRRTIAHEVNNALAPIVGYAELIKVGAGDPKFYASLILEAAEDLAKKVTALTLTASPDKVVNTPVGPVFDLSEPEDQTKSEQTT